MTAGLGDTRMTKPADPRFAPIPALETCARLSLTELLERFPGAVPGGACGSREDLFEYFEGDEFVLVPGHTRIPQDWAPEQPDSHRLHVVVDGDLDAGHCPRAVFFVAGELHCDSINLQEARLYPRGARVVARHWAAVIADDDCHRGQAPAVRLEAPYLFCWFHELDEIDLSPRTVVFIVSDWEYSHQLALPNPMFRWHEALFALRRECTGWLYSPRSDEIPWDWRAVGRLAAIGQSPFIEGFQLGSLPFESMGDECLAAGDMRGAYLAYRRAAALSPGHYGAWFGMGEALRRAGAYGQALPHYQRAAGQFPEGQPGLVNQAANHAALCAIRARQLPLAVDCATQSIDNNRDHLEKREYDCRDCAPAYRLRGEALHLMGRREEALADLQRAVELDERNGTALWLLGLMHHMAGDAAQARRLRQAAMQCSGDYDVAYGAGASQSTDFLARDPIWVDWEETPDDHPLPVKDEAYWRAFLAAEDPEKIRKVPAALRTTALCMGLLAKAEPHDGHARFARHFPGEAFTESLALALVRLSGDNLRHIPGEWVTRELCLEAPLPGDGEARGFALDAVPRRLLDRELVFHAVRCGSGLKDVPEAFLDKALCLQAVRLWAYELENVPLALRDDECHFAAIASGCMFFFLNDLPAAYRAPEMLRRAIAHDKRSLDRIAGSLFDTELFAHAKVSYGDDADWDDIVARHSPAFCSAHPDADFAEVCWSVFWDEALILAQVGNGDRRLSPFEIPRALFTQAVAEACMRRDLIHLDRLPRRFVTQAMCDRFIGEYPDMLDHVPVARRTRALCDRAMKKDPTQLPEVPVAHRHLAMCRRAVLEDSDNLVREVPHRLRRQLFDWLISRHSDDFDTGWLTYQRGEGALLQDPPDIAQALADFGWLAAGGAGEGFAEWAAYSFGYCKHLQGWAEEAEAWRRKVDDPSAWWSYSEYAARGLTHPREPKDWDRPGFGEWMDEAQRLADDKDYRRALDAVLQAERLLVADGVNEPQHWGDVMSRKIELSLALGLARECTEACQETIERFRDEPQWECGRGESQARQALCAAHHRLAAGLAGGLAPDTLRERLRHAERAIELYAVDDPENVPLHFSETRDTLLRALAEPPSP